MIKKLLDLGNRYANKSDWRDFALVKFCLFSMGLMAGMFVKKKYRLPVICVSFIVFLATYIPLMTKLFKIAVKNNRDAIY